MNQSPPTGRMLRRAIFVPAKQREGSSDHAADAMRYFLGIMLVKRRSLNPTVKQRQQIRAKHLEEIYQRSLIHFPDNPLRPAEYCKRLGMGIVDFVELPYTYLQAGHYFNNFKPRV